MNFINKKIVGKIVNVLLNILIFVFCIFLLITIYNFIQIKILKNDHSNFFGYSIFEVQTGSMATKINPGDWIIVKLNVEPKLNDIVTYRQNNEYITHRVVEVYKGTYITKGDANNSKDEPIDQSQIIGKTVKILAGFGILRKTLFNPPVLITLIITLFLFDSVMKKKKIIENKNMNKFTDDIMNKIIELKNKILNKTDIKNKLVDATKTVKTKIKKIDTKKLKKKVTIKEVKKEEKIEEVNEKKTINKIFTPEEEKIEEELSKTSVFRVLSVDSTDVPDKIKKTKKEELDKTSSLRFINVDTSDLETKEEAKDNSPVFKVTLSKNDEVIVEEQKNEIDIEILKKDPTIKKGKNIIDKAMNIKEAQIEEILSILDIENSFLNKSATIKNIYINAYIAIKYYNIYDEFELEETKKSPLKTKKTLQLVTNNLLRKEKKHENLINIYNNIFKLIDSIEKNSLDEMDSKERKQFYKEEFDKYYKIENEELYNNIIYRINDVEKKYESDIKELLDKLETSTFELKFNKIMPNKQLYGIEMKHNIAFSKVYSDYIVDKTYNEGIVAEDKMAVLLTLLQTKLVKDMLNSEFNNKYLIYIPSELYTKEKKITGILNIIDNEYAKNNILILVNYIDLTKYKKVIKKLRKDGYKFALVFDKETTVDEKYKGCIYMFDYIFINKDIIEAENIISALPEELLKNISFDDIIGKVGDFLKE